MSDKLNRRDQVKECITAGTYTKAEIAEKLGVNAASVSSQMTYLRWMGHYIITNPETKALSFCTAEEAEVVAETAKASRKVKEAKDPQARANTLAKTIKAQEKQLATAQDKLAKIENDLVEEPEDRDLQELLAEAQANVTLLVIKLKRNKIASADLPAPAEVTETAVEDDDAPEAVEDSDELL